MAKITKILFGSFIVLIITVISFLADNKVFAADPCAAGLKFLGVEQTSIGYKNIKVDAVASMGRPTSCPDIFTVALMRKSGSIYTPAPEFGVKTVDLATFATYQVVFKDVPQGFYDETYDYQIVMINPDTGADVSAISGLRLTGFTPTPDVTPEPIPPFVETNPTTGTTTGTTPSTGGGAGTSGGGGTPSVSAAEGVVKSMVTGVYFIALALGIVIAIIKIILAIMKVAISSGDPNTLNEAKDEAYSTLMGLLVILGAVTLITMLGKALGL